MNNQLGNELAEGHHRLECGCTDRSDGHRWPYVRRANALLPIFERHLARKRVAIESQIAEHVAVRERAARAETAESIERVRKVADELDKPDGSGDRIAAGLIRRALDGGDAS